MDVNDPSNFRSSLVPDGLLDLGRVEKRCHPRCRKESGDQFQNIGVALVGIIETGCVDEDDLSSVESEFIRELNFCGARFQVQPNAEARSAGLVDKLNRW